MIAKTSSYRSSLVALIAILFFGCTNPTYNTKESTGITSEEDSLLNLVQRQTFNYFWDNAETNSGLAKERTHMDDIHNAEYAEVVTSGGSGFGVMAIIVGVERGFVSREEAIVRFQKILSFLEAADSYHGAFPHWWNGQSGKTRPFSPKDDGGDLVETAFLIQGLITVRQYFDRQNENESNLRNRINALWEAVEWDWYTQGKNVLYWHWSPNHGWEMNFPVRGYNECLIMYILAASSSTHGVKAAVYHEGWSQNGAIISSSERYDLKLELDHYADQQATVGPLFWAHYSYLGLDPNGLKDQYAEYWKLNVNHAKIHYKHCVANPNDFARYGEKVWGLTSSYSMNGYAGHQPDHDLGIISPTAALSSFPYTPKESMRMLKYLYIEADTLVGKYGPYDAFSLESDWYVERYLAIDQGPIPVMIENYRTGLLWRLFMSAPEIQNGLDKLGFQYKHY